VASVASEADAKLKASSDEAALLAKQLLETQSKREQLEGELAKASEAAQESRRLVEERERCAPENTTFTALAC
jgi:hypothetical protein